MDWGATSTKTWKDVGPDFQASISIRRGPLIFAFPIGESWVKLRDRGLTADWQIFPSTSWNYALSPSSLERITVIESAVGKVPFSLKNAPVQLEVSARLLDSWRAVDGVADPVPQSPVSSPNPDTTITLIPYGAAKLRITSFPHLGIVT